MSTDQPTPQAPEPPQPIAEPKTEAGVDVKTVLRRLGPAGPLAIIAATLPAIGGFTLLWKLNDIGPWLKAHGETGVALYTLGFAILAGLALLPTYAQAVLGGWAFGVRIGLPAALGGFVGGALIGYIIALRATGDRVVNLIREKPKWKAVHDALLHSGFWKTLLIITLVRIPLNSPFAITNLVMAATRVPPLAYIIGTLVGMTPRTAAAVIIAANLRELTFEGTQQKWMWIASIVVTLLVIVIIGHVANKAITKVTTADRATPAP